MASVRRRKSPSVQPPVSGKLSSGSALHSSASKKDSKDGWQAPKNPVRRQGSHGFGSALSSPSTGCSGHSGNATVHPCQSQVSVPNQVSVAQSGSLKDGSQQSLPRDINPFSALVSELETMAPDSSMDPTPIQPKRARPIDSNQQRRAPKASKAKGKGSIIARGKEPESFTFSASADSILGSGPQSRRGTKKPRSSAEPILDPASGAPQLEQLGAITHEAVVYQLKQAILKDNTAGEKDSALSGLARGKGILEDLPPDCAHSAEDLPGDRSGVPPSDIFG